MPKLHSNTDKKVSTHKRNTSGLIPFKSGYDPRRNTKGRPKAFDELRELFQDIAHDEVVIEGKKMTRVQAIGLLMSSSPDKFQQFLEYAYGKVPLSQIVDITSGGKPIGWKDFIDNASDDTDTEASNNKS